MADFIFVLLLFSSLFGLGGCATPTSKLTALAENQGFERGQVNAAGFDLMVFDNIKRPRDESEVNRLHVYLEGDGSPWKHRHLIMRDPTPRNPIMLRLMRLDKQPSVYIGRPCYNGSFGARGCDNRLWTSARYSRQVVESMAVAIRELAQRYAVSELWLLGHSGGGTLAMLLAHDLPRVSRVVTVAGNLDIEAWTDHHAYTPLYTSINPADLSPLPQDIWQWHLVGGRDQVIPPFLVKPMIAREPSASGIEIPAFNHGCCWEQFWPQILRALQANDPKQLKGQHFKDRAGSASATGHL